MGGGVLVYECAPIDGPRPAHAAFATMTSLAIAGIINAVFRKVLP